MIGVCDKTLGAVQERVAWEFPAVADSPVGAGGRKRFLSVVSAPLLELASCQVALPFASLVSTLPAPGVPPVIWRVLALTDVELTLVALTDVGVRLLGN